jgi:hypothetical protein
VPLAVRWQRRIRYWRVVTSEDLTESSRAA